MATRNGSATWHGDLMTGSGELTVGEAAWTAGYSFSRFSGVLPNAPADGAGGTTTNPEELLAASHAACFSMALSLNLTQAGTPPRSIDTTARVHLRVVEGIPTIQRVDLETVADAPGVDERQLRELAEQAKDTCIISRALAGVQEITLNAALGSDASAREAAS